MNASRMAELFQVNLDNSLDDDRQGAPVVAFSQKAEDVQAVLEPVPLKTEIKMKSENKNVSVVSNPQNDTELIHAAIRNGVTCPPLIEAEVSIENEEENEDLDTEIPGDVLDEVHADIQKFRSKIEQEAHISAIIENDTELKHASKPEPEHEPEPEPVKVISKPQSNPIKDENNPLGLDGQDLKAYHVIKEKYGDKFTLYDGSLAYRDFYKYKVHALRHLLGQFPLLNLAEMRNELLEVQTNHFIGDDMCTPDLIRVKLDSAQAHRTRLSSLLTIAFAQHPAWERFLDMSRSKLWKDHDVKGAHRRDGMVMEHLSDMESYVANLKGFIDSGKQYDAMLKSAAESLSRQLTCLQLNEYTGTNRIEGRETPQTQQKPRPPIMQSADLLEDLDAVDTGTVISAPRPKANEAVTTVSYGQEDEFSQLG